MFFEINPLDVAVNASKSEFFHKDAAFQYLKTVDKKNFEKVSGQPILKHPPAPSTWLYFGTKDDDDIYLGDSYDWRNRNDGKPSEHFFGRYYIYLSEA